MPDASSPIRHFNFQFIAHQDCFFQRYYDIKFLLTLLTKKICVLAYHAIFSNFPDEEIFLCALLKISAAWIFPTTQCHLHFTDYDILLKALLSALSQFLTKFFWYSRNMRFTTKDKYNDVRSSGNYALGYNGGWWYNSCHNANPNGLYKGGGRAWSIT